jgi:hypothetical protein
MSSQQVRLYAEYRDGREIVKKNLGVDTSWPYKSVLPASMHVADGSCHLVTGNLCLAACHGNLDKSMQNTRIKAAFNNLSCT